ncbi:MAG: glycosyltransferase 87 family protein [Promethearchaeota archaeon]
MDDLSQKTKKLLLILPIIPISIALVYSLIIEFFFKSSVSVRPFCDFYVFKQVFENYPMIYNDIWYVYTSAFVVEFFWIKFIPFYYGVAIWIILKIIIIVLIWRTLLFSKDMRNIFELLVFAILVLILGMVNEIYTENSDTLLLACGFLSYICLDKAQKIQKDEGYSSKYTSKNQTIILYNIFAGFIIAFGIFKPIFIIFLPLLFFKSNRKLIFISMFFIWLLVSNVPFIIYPELIIQYIERAGGAQTLVGEELLFKNNFLNIIFRNGYTPFRVQIWLYPAIMLYINDYIKNEKIRKYWAVYYLIGFIVFNILSLLLFALGF